jgi:hypothetical protein
MNIFDPIPLPDGRPRLVKRGEEFRDEDYEPDIASTQSVNKIRQIEAARKRAEVSERALNILRQYQPISGCGIARVMGVHWEIVRTALKPLIASGRIVRPHAELLAFPDYKIKPRDLDAITKRKTEAGRASRKAKATIATRTL